MGEGGAGPVRREKASDGRTVGGGQWESALSEEENAILDMEERWWAHGRRKADAIATLGMSQTRYYLALNRILMDPRSRMERPELVGRLIRLRERRMSPRALFSPVRVPERERWRGR